jgi:hypothetical protein
MIELRRFQLQEPKCQSNAFDFERASVALLSMHQHRGDIVLNLQMRSECRDPATFQQHAVVQQGVHRHG